MKHQALAEEAFERFVQWATDQPAVRAMLITSSHASPGALVDLLSDYDLILILTDIHPFFDDRAWLSDFGPVLAAYRDPILVDGGLETSGYVVQYDNGLKIDFTLWPLEMLARVTAAPQLPDEFDAGYRIVLDKDGLTGGLKAPTYAGYIPKTPTETQYLEIIEWFFLDTIYVAKFLWRDDLMATKHVLDNIMKQDYLRPMLEWRSEIDHGWSVKPGPIGRRLKLWLRPDLWTELESTYTGAGIEANWEALFRTIALFRRVANEVGALLGFNYPQELDQRAVAYLRRIKNLDRQAETFS